MLEFKELIRIVPLAVADSLAVEALLDQAFGSDRHQRTAYRLREGTAEVPELSFAAFDSSNLVGSLQSWPIQLNCDDGSVQSLIMVGPVAVLPELQRSGVGRSLMNHMLREADSNGVDAMTLIGDPEYYDRFFGFTTNQTQSWDVPGPVERHRLLARLSGNRLHGRRGMLGPRIAVLR